MRQNTFQTIGQLTQENAAAIAQDWHYDGEYAFYDMENDQEDYEEIMSPMLRGDRYFQVLDEGSQLVAFFLPGGDDRTGPDRSWPGHGSKFNRPRPGHPVNAVD